jgi:hypothetical protein
MKNINILESSQNILFVIMNIYIFEFIFSQILQSFILTKPRT